MKIIRIMKFTMREIKRIIIYTIKIRRHNPTIVAVKFFLYELFRINKEIKINVYGFSIYIRPASPDIDVALTSLGSELDPVIKSFPDIGDGIVVDAGGYIGTAALKLATAYPDHTILTIEPSTENIRLLKKNISDMKNIIPIQAALSTTITTLDLKNRGTGQWGFTIVPEPSDKRDARLIESVPTVTIEKLLTDSRTKAISILKMDIEGGEFDLFKEKPYWLDDTKIILIELHDRIVNGCTESFERATGNRINLVLGGEKVLSLSRKIYDQDLVTV